MCKHRRGEREVILMSDSGKTSTQVKHPASKILVDGGDPQDTVRMKRLLGFVDG